MGFEQFMKPKKGRWTPEETDLLQQCVDEEPNPENPNWAAIEERFSGKRTAKQIRERWSNHINPIIVKRTFTKDEIHIIETEFAKHKFKWARIASKLENATPLM
ncbi:1315_t:CDS:2 [Diversispora eburnea]|uniref:1315_t:CDS:1 n=1 Tax=Diversispora eburnea TaxID=1213867 RepID=A0A9N8YR40_9GLOM|nr:1315_t:CDS:2 [Diversispora eburnea]